MIVFFDTSALVKRYVNEANSSVMLTLWTSASVLAVSQILYAEMTAAFARRRRETLRVATRSTRHSTRSTVIGQVFIAWQSTMIPIGVSMLSSSGMRFVAQTRFISPRLCC